MGIITNTYSDEDIVKTFLVLELYDASTLTANITAQAKNAKKWMNTYIGKQFDFSGVELAEIKNEGIILSASQKTACLMELKRQERAGTVAEETKIDCDAAEATLNAWCYHNGITPPTKKGGIPTSVKIPFVYSGMETTITPPPPPAGYGAGGYGE